MSKIEQIISEIEEYIDGCKYQALSNTKIIVNRDELDELINELKSCIPDEITKYQRIISNRDAILKDAQDKADDMVKKANEMTSALVSEHEIMQQAFKEANNVIEEATTRAGGILDKATTEANEVKMAAMQYTDDALANIQEILSSSIEGMTIKYDELLRSLESNLDLTTANRKALHRPSTPEKTKEIREAQPEYTDTTVMDDLFDQQPLSSQVETAQESIFGDEFGQAEQVSYEDAIYDSEIGDMANSYDEPVYGTHNPQQNPYQTQPLEYEQNQMSLEDAYNQANVDVSVLTGRKVNDVSEITNFNLDISDF